MRSRNRRACWALTRSIEIWPGRSNASSTPRLVISLNVTRRAFVLESFSASFRCQAMASPSRSGSGARYTISADLEDSFRSLRTLLLPRTVAYLGSKSFSMSIPNSRSGRSRTWPMQAFTTNLEPRILLIVLALAGDSTMTRDLPDPLFLGFGDSDEASAGALTFDFLGMAGGGV